MNDGKKTFSPITTALVTLVLSSCVPNVSTSLRSRDTTNLINGSTSVNPGQGRVLTDNPIILAKNPSLSESYDLNRLLTTVDITTDAFLKANTSCSGLDYCFEVRENKDSPSALQTSDGKWAFNVYTPQFLEVNTFYHLDKIFDRFFYNLNKSYSWAYDSFGFYQYDTALPLGLMSSPNVYKGMSAPLIAYANCDVKNNAYYERSTQTLCLGYLEGHSKVKWAQDSSVVYHETGHFFQKLQLNFRNYNNLVKSDMGNGFYDEAGSIGEGLADFYSYYVNGRTHFAEWGAGRYLNADRPMKETDPLHSVPLSADADGRLSYPEYLTYNPYTPTIPAVDIHTSAMIASHYLVALTEDLMSKCNMTQPVASETVIHLINETLAELGDLSSVGTVTNAARASKINLDSGRSYDWFSKVNPLNFRSFAQTMAKNLLITLGNSNLNKCNNGIYDKDQIESLLDQYGLLLFRTYNENRNLSNPGVVSNTAVNATNRKKSVMVSKNLIILDPSPNASSAYVIDNRTQIKDAITSLQAAGVISSLSSQTPSDLGFNNNNGKVSPGEVVALAVNLYNNSNSTMAGVQVLANDWNHADINGKPCQFGTSMSNDQWPLISEGGVSCSTVAATAETDFAPVCFMQANESSATKWVSQKEFKTKMALDSSFCLDSNNDKDCFIRAIKGADQAIFAKLKAKSNWTQSLANGTSATTSAKYDNGNTILFEVSKHIPPGTIVDCRLRVRFTNCDDCYHDSTRSHYDYKDVDYNGPRPFKVIHLQIPITD